MLEYHNSRVAGKTKRKVYSDQLTLAPFIREVCALK